MSWSVDRTRFYVFLQSRYYHDPFAIYVYTDIYLLACAACIYIHYKLNCMHMHAHAACMARPTAYMAGRPLYIIATIYNSIACANTTYSYNTILLLFIIIVCSHAVCIHTETYIRKSLYTVNIHKYTCYTQKHARNDTTEQKINLQSSSALVCSLKPSATRSVFSRDRYST